MIRRREFITLLGGAAAAWPITARAQQPGRLPTIGFLGRDATAWSQRTAAFVQRLRDLGWVDGRTVAIEYRWSEGRAERVADIAADLVRLKVDVIFAFSDAVPALKQATSAIPIVFALGRDPIGGGLVSSLARPGRNVTGLSSQAADTAARRIELLREAVPHLRRLAILADASDLFDLSGLETREAQTAARALGIETELLEIRRAQDIVPVFMELKADALYVVGGAPELVRGAFTVGHQPAGLDIVSIKKDRRQPRAKSERDDPRAVGGNKSTADNVKSVRLQFHEDGNNVLRSPDFEQLGFDAEGAGRRLRLACLQPG